MKKYQRISFGILIGVVSFTTLYFGALWALPNVVDLNKYKTDFSKAIEEQSGFKFSCEDIKLARSFSPYLNVKMHHTIMLYPNDEVFLKLKDSELKVKLLPLIFKKIVIKDAKLTRPIINITLYDDFSTSIERYFDATKNISTNGFAIDAIIKDTICERYKLKINDEVTGKLFYLEGDDLLLKDVKLNEKIHFILKGALFENEKEYLKYDLDILAPLISQKSKFTFSPFKAIYDSDIKGEISGKLQFDKNNNIDGYLNVQNISLKADDIVLKDNNLNFVFNGQEAQIKSILHTSNLDVAEVNGKLAYGKKKTIDLTTKAKNIDLKNLHKVLTIIAQTLNVPNQLKDVSITGLVDADFIINSDFKKLKSSGTAKVINAKIQHNLLPYAVSNINANINLDNNNILIEQAQALVNSTPVNITGKIKEDVSVDLNVVSENLNLKKLVDIFKVELPVNIQNGNLSLTSQITGCLNKALNINANIILSDLSLLEKHLVTPLKIKEAKINLNTDTKNFAGNVVISEFLANYKQMPITANVLNLSFDDKKIVLKDNELLILESPFKISGIINDYKNKPNIDLSFDGELLASDLSKILKDVVNQPHKAQGKLKTNGKLIVNDSSADLKMQVNADAQNYLSYVVVKEILNKPSKLIIDCVFKDKFINLKNISLVENEKEVKNSIFSLSGGLKLDKDILLDDVKISIPNTVSFSTSFFGGEDVSLTADLILNDSICNPQIKGKANVSTLNIKKYLTAIRNAELNFEQNNIKVTAPDVQINNSKLNLYAEVDKKIKDKLSLSNVHLLCANLDVNTLFELIEKEANPLAKSLITVKNGIAIINKFSILDLKAKDISADFSLNDNILSVKNISANAYSGQVDGGFDYDIPHSNLHIMLNGKNIDMKSSLYDLCKLDDNIAGIADFGTDISMQTGEYNSVLNSLKGTLDFKSTNGKMGTLGKFEYYLYAQNILYHGLLKTTLNRIADIFKKGGDTAQYRTAYGSINFADGYMSTQSVKTIGNDMSLYVKGRHNLISNQVNIDIYGRISDEITSQLGSFGNISIADLLESKSQKINHNVMFMPQQVIDEIPLLYNQGIAKTNTFKVNLLGDINSLSAINSFMWIVPQENKPQEPDILPEFSDMLQNL